MCVCVCVGMCAATCMEVIYMIMINYSVSLLYVWER